MIRKQLLIWATVLATLSGLWVVAVQTQGVQCGGSFVPSSNCTISGRWLWTNITTGAGTITQGPIPGQVRDQNNNPVDITGIVSRTTDLTNADVLALVGTPVTVVPAPGAGYYVTVLSVDLIFNYTTAYTAGSDLALYWGSRSAGNRASAVITASGFIVSVSADTTVRVEGVPDNTRPPTTNLPVVISQIGSPAFAGGNGANSVRVVVNYRIVRTGLSDTRMRVLVVVLTVYWVIDLWSVHLWRSEAALFQQAWYVSPDDPRSALNYAKALYGMGRDADAASVAAGARLGP